MAISNVNRVACSDEHRVHLSSTGQAHCFGFHSQCLVSCNVLSKEQNKPIKPPLFMAVGDMCCVYNLFLLHPLTKINKNSGLKICYCRFN